MSSGIDDSKFAEDDDSQFFMTTGNRKSVVKKIKCRQNEKKDLILTTIYDTLRQF